MDLQDVFEGSSNKQVDYVQYSIYLPPQDDNFIAYLQDTIVLIQSFIQPFITDHLWQKDDFHLSIVKDANNDPSYPFLHGSTRFGDCINDEWFIIYLLFQISKHLPTSVISVSDTDGDVLLIEAALELPSWLDPSNSDNRVYIHQGQVHVIPLPSSPADILQFQSTGRLLRQQAIRLVQPTTVAHEGIQRAIQDRIIHPDHEIHRALCTLPKRAAYVLLSHPQLLPYAIEAFYLRDPDSLKACSRMSTFPPIHSIDTVVRFTRTTFAQTVSQKFYPPRAFRLPSINQKRAFAQAELGMKVACGLEMLYDASQREFDDQPEVDKGYEGYRAHLTKLGYFRNEREGSAMYRQLEAKAREYYLSPKGGESSVLDVEEGRAWVVPPHQIMNGLLKGYSEEALEALLEANKNTQPDGDEWMHVDPKQLEDMLMKRMGQEHIMKDLAKDFGEDMDLEKIMSNLEDFVENRQSGVDGVEFPGEDESGDEYDDDDDDEEGNIRFDVDKFMSILKGTFEEDHEEEEEKEEEEEEKLADIMKEMDQEIAGHEKITGSFEKQKTNQQQQQEEEDEDEDAPVDVQLNLVKNVLESFKSQQGLPGPVGNILNQFGVILPGDNEEQEDDD